MQLQNIIGVNNYSYSHNSENITEDWPSSLQVADIHMYENNVKSQQGRLKVEKMEKELAALINSSMSYKSVYSKTAKQMAMEAMQACESEAAASSKKIRKTVVETASKRAVVA